MEKQYQRYVATLFATLLLYCIITAALFLLSINGIVRHNHNLLEMQAVSVARERLEQMVENIIVRIDNMRADMLSETESLYDSIGNFLETEHLDSKEGRHYLESIFKLESGFPIHIIVQYRDESMPVRHYSKDGIEEMDAISDELLQQIQNSIKSLVVQDENAMYYLFMDGQEIENLVKAHIYKEIHNTIFIDEKYIWVNEILNFEGGENYAVRYIHPNMVDTEGSYLSTFTEDKAGNLPYKIELEGIRKNGEVFHSYYFKNLTNDNTEEKYSYAKLYEPYNWIIAAGEPVSDILSVMESIDEDSREVRNILLLLCLSVELLMVAWLFVMQNRYRKSVNIYVEKEIRLDALTGALTRKVGQMALETNFQTYHQMGRNWMVMIIDVDKFKDINDTYGHGMGDIVLTSISQTIQENIRESDYLIRWGGDEFVLMFFGADKNHHSAIAAKILECVTQVKPEGTAADFKVSLSIGYTSFKPEDKDCAEALERADKAVYFSKTNGRGRYTDYDDMLEMQKGKVFEG